MVNRFDVYIVVLGPTTGSEMEKSRPCLIVSPDVMNSNLNTVIIAPMTTTIRNYPSRVKTTFQDKEGDIALDQIRTVDKQRLERRLGQIDSVAKQQVAKVLTDMFGL